MKTEKRQVNEDKGIQGKLAKGRGRRGTQEKKGSGWRVTADWGRC